MVDHSRPAWTVAVKPSMLSAPLIYFLALLIFGPLFFVRCGAFYPPELPLQHHYAGPRAPNTTVQRSPRGERAVTHDGLCIGTTSGTYLGFTNNPVELAHPVETWLGVPYARPPVGELRFRAPILCEVPPEERSDVHPAFNFGNACPQAASFAMDVPIAEDCLTLNVYRPAGLGNTHSFLPVLVWIHGGALTTGTSAAFDGSIIVSSSVDLGKPIIFVSINYRLNSFGFLNTDDLPLDDLQVGLKDQIKSLEWLQLNLKAFGGDPHKVTIWGESAGAFSVSLLSTYLQTNQTLFRAAIMDSGSPTSHTVPAVSVYDRVGMPYNLLVNITGCNLPCHDQHNRTIPVDRLKCLRDLPYEVLFNATQAVTKTAPFPRQLSVWGPSYKAGSLIDERPSKRFEEGRFLHIPMIMGTNKDEGTLAAVGSAQVYPCTNKSADDYFFSFMSNTSILDRAMIDPKVYNDLARLYPNDPSVGSPFDTSTETFGLPPIFKRLAAWFGDLHYQAPRRLWSGKTWQYQPTYVYYFDGPPKSTDPAYGGVFHSSELPLIFGSTVYRNLPEAEITATAQLAARMRKYYINFVNELNPGADWPLYREDKKVMRFNKCDNGPVIIDDNWRTDQLAFLNSHAALNSFST